MSKKQTIIAIIAIIAGIGFCLVMARMEKQNDAETSVPETHETLATVSETEESVFETLTIENCEELASLLTLKDPFDASVAKFAEDYKGATIEFDACIAAMSNHGDYKTRYDILIYAGDYSETTVSGPSFQFVDVGVFDLGVDGLDLPSYISAGKNVHIIAEVGEFNPNSGLFELDPVSVTER